MQLHNATLHYITLQSQLLNALLFYIFLKKPRGTKQLPSFLPAINEEKYLVVISQFVLPRSE